MTTKMTAPFRSETRWTPGLIRQLRGKRTQKEFSLLVGTTKNTVWRWEAGRVAPDSGYAARLSKLAARERFFDNWQLVGSVSLIGNLETAKAAIAKLFAESLRRSAGRIDR